uniref:Uncharacterized protein n=2 Tax=Chlamydomonas leiostraca TaxID=1034604 RepID=A0A7S0WK68_9CHLO
MLGMGARRESHKSICSDGTTALATSWPADSCASSAHHTAMHSWGARSGAMPGSSSATAGAAAPSSSMADPHAVPSLLQLQAAIASGSAKSSLDLLAAGPATSAHAAGLPAAPFRRPASHSNLGLHLRSPSSHQVQAGAYCRALSSSCSGGVSGAAAAAVKPDPDAQMLQELLDEQEVAAVVSQARSTPEPLPLEDELAKLGLQPLVKLRHKPAAPHIDMPAPAAAGAAQLRHHLPASGPAPTAGSTSFLHDSSLCPARLSPRQQPKLTDLLHMAQYGRSSAVSAATVQHAAPAWGGAARGGARQHTNAHAPPPAGAAMPPIAATIYTAARPSGAGPAAMECVQHTGAGVSIAPPAAAMLLGAPPARRASRELAGDLTGQLVQPQSAPGMWAEEDRTLSDLLASLSDGAGTPEQQCW